MRGRRVFRTVLENHFQDSLKSHAPPSVKRSYATYTLHVQKVVNLQIHYYVHVERSEKQTVFATHWALGSVAGGLTCPRWWLVVGVTLCPSPAVSSSPSSSLHYREVAEQGKYLIELETKAIRSRFAKISKSQRN